MVQFFEFVGVGMLGALIGWVISRFRTDLSLAKEREALTAEVTLKAALFERCDADRAKLELQFTSLQQEYHAERTSRATFEEKAARAQDCEREMAALREEVQRLRVLQREGEVRLSEKEKSLQEKMELLARAEEEFKVQFRSISTEVLKENTASFLQTAQETLESKAREAEGRMGVRQAEIDKLMKPLKETLDSLEASRQGAYASLVEQVKALGSGQMNLQQETSRLVQALRTPNVRGRWGELQLKRVVEISGMIEHCDFQQQESRVVDNQNRIRPDMIIKMPNGRSIVVDAKVPLQAYSQAVEAKDEDTRTAQLKIHASQVRAHVEGLSKKEYWSQFQPGPDFVFLFIPAESIYSAALQYDATLIEFGASHRVMIATPSTLITLLQTVAHGWKEAHIAQNAEEVCKLGKELFERISTFGGHFDAVRNGLDKAVDSYNKAMRSLETRVLPSARKLKDLGITSDKAIEELEPIELKASVALLGHKTGEEE